MFEKAVFDDLKHEENKCLLKLRCVLESAFIASNGVELRSYRYPCYTCINRVYTRGSLNTKKNEPIKFPSLEDYNRFIEAVNEYNNYPFQPQIKEVTLDEIEKQLGYKIKIVNK